MKVGFDAIRAESQYHHYLQRLDARALLEHYGAENCREECNRDGTTEIIHSCLLDRVEPHHSNGDQNPSAAVNVDKKTFVCYALGFGCDLFHLVAKLERVESFSDSLSVIGNFLTGAVHDNENFRAEVEKLFSSEEAYCLNLPSYDPKVIEPWRTFHPYWEQRGITQHAIDHLLLGYDPQARRIVFPHFVDTILVGWQKRVIPGETYPDYPKYKNSPGFPKSETIYHLDEARNYPRVCVVESPMSVARAVSLGLPNVVATFGASVNHHQIDQLKDFETVYVWFDRDGAGLEGERKLVQGLYRHTQVLVVAPERGKDMADADLPEIAQKLSVAEPAALRLGAYEQFRRTR